MRLTLWTDYALRTLIYVGAKGGRLATIAEIAESFDISKTHLMKVVNRLGQQGYIDTIRGKGGGIRLVRPPREIRVGAVVRETEEELAVMGCLAETGFCRIEGAPWTVTPWPTFWRRVRGSSAAWASISEIGLGDEPSSHQPISPGEPHHG
jgi:Rrf2 family protein